MRHHLFTNTSSDSYPIALLIKATAFTKHEMVKAYVKPLVEQGVAAEDMIGFTLQYDDAKKVSVKTIKEYLAELLPELDALGTKTLFVMDGQYFKILAGQKKSEGHMGYVLPCKVAGYEHMNVVLGMNWQVFVHNPEARDKLALSIKALADHQKGEYALLGSDIIHEEYYPESLQAIQEALESLHGYPSISADIEAFSLRFEKAGIGTCAFAIDQHNGFAFACDYEPLPEKNEAGEYGKFVRNDAVRQLLKDFLSTYKGRIRWHRSQYDLKVIVYTLWMDNLLDQKGCLEGLDVVFATAEDTKHIAYLATNSTAGNELGLKTLAHPFAGNYAQDEISDIRKIPLPQLLRYNLTDCLCTNYVYDTYWPRLVNDQQEPIYRHLFMPSQKVQTQMELVGMPMDVEMLKNAEAELMGISVGHRAFLANQPLIREMDDWVQKKAMAAANRDLKTFCKLQVCFENERFNPGSPQQLAVLLHEKMNLPIIDTTETDLASTGGATLKKLIHHCTNNDHVLILEALIGWAEAAKVLGTFIKAFKEGIKKSEDGILWLHGNFNLGGTVSGRLSSSEPNMQNIPAKSVFGKLIKMIFRAPSGWLFGGADFNSLEDYISALTSRDPNKLKVYIDGFDGHALRACAYYPEELGHIDINNPKEVNQLKKDDHPLRQESKTPTFALTYQGTYYTLMQNLGWPEEKAKRIEAAYHDLYKVSDEYIQNRIRDEACGLGYVTVAFGLRIRTPLLGKVVYGPKMPYEAKAEGRTVGNAMGQSYCMLNNRAAVDFFNKVWASEFRYDILPCAMIHDAIYILMRDDPAVVEWANRELVASMSWQDLPELEHDTVKIGAALDIFWPNWSNGITLPVNASQADIIATCQKGMQKWEDAQREKLKEAA